MAKKRNTTKRLSKKKLEEMKDIINYNLGKRFGVTTSTISYHRDQIRKSLALDAKIYAYESSQGKRPAGIESEAAIRLKESAEDQIHRLKDRVQALELDRDRWKINCQQRDELISIYAMKEHNLI